MPLLHIHTNQEVPLEGRADLLRRASARVAGLLGKPERYVMVVLDCNPAMLFAGDSAPLAYLELKSIGLPAGRTAELSAGLCGLLSETLGIPSERVYIELADIVGQMWGWNGGTF
jgi:phenylpyruvate tautomerase